MTSTSPAPSSMTAPQRTDQLSERQGPDQGLDAAGKRSEEKKTPDNSHMGSMTRFMSPLTASVVVAGRPTSRPIPANARAPSMSTPTTRARLPRIGMWNIKLPEQQEHGQVGEDESQARPQNGQQEIAPGHRRGHEPLEQLGDPEVDQQEADSPEPAPHRVEPDQAGDQEVDVARAGLRDVARPRSASGSVRPAARWRTSSISRAGRRLRSRRIVAIRRRTRPERFDDQRRLARLQPRLASSSDASWTSIGGHVQSRRPRLFRAFERRVVGLDRGLDLGRPRLLDQVDSMGAGGRFWNANPSAIARSVGKP